MIDKFRKNCFGCTACGEVCPVGAIDFERNNLGFIYPIIKEDKCIRCNKCEKICPVATFKETLNEKSKTAFAARHNNLSEVETSRSGAVFTAISDAVFLQGGVVYGASFDDNFNVIHSVAKDKETCRKFKGSKYVQSDLRGIIKNIKDELVQGKKVLFSGTPCQVAGVKASISKELSANLYVVDIVCHGTPSPRLWSDYVQHVRKSYKGVLKEFNFRDKSINGWSDHVESYVIGDKKYSSKLFTHLFYSNSFFRESCYSCPFAILNRAGDITLADFWGWEKIDKDLNSDNKGISLVLVNSDKGHELFDNANKDLRVKKVEIEQCLQPNLIRPTKDPEKRKVLVDYYTRKGFENLVRYVTKPSLFKRILKKIKNLIQK